MTIEQKITDAVFDMIEMHMLARKPLLKGDVMACVSGVMAGEPKLGTECGCKKFEQAAAAEAERVEARLEELARSRPECPAIENCIVKISVWTPEGDLQRMADDTIRFRTASGVWPVAPGALRNAADQKLISYSDYILLTH